MKNIVVFGIILCAAGCGTIDAVPTVDSGNLEASADGGKVEASADGGRVEASADGGQAEVSVDGGVMEIDSGVACTVEMSTCVYQGPQGTKTGKCLGGTCCLGCIVSIAGAPACVARNTDWSCPSQDGAASGS